MSVWLQDLPKKPTWQIYKQILNIHIIKSLMAIFLVLNEMNPKRLSLLWGSFQISDELKDDVVRGEEVILGDADPSTPLRSRLVSGAEPQGSL